MIQAGSMRMNSGTFARKQFFALWLCRGLDVILMCWEGVPFKENETMQMRTELRGQERVCGDWATLFAFLNYSPNA